jgi:hypothetical protein
MGSQFYYDDDLLSDTQRFYIRSLIFKSIFIVTIFFLFGYTPLFLPVPIESIWVIPSLRVWSFVRCLDTCTTLLVCYNYVRRVVRTWVAFEPITHLLLNSKLKIEAWSVPHLPLYNVCGLCWNGTILLQNSSNQLAQ